MKRDKVVTVAMNEVDMKRIEDAKAAQEVVLGRRLTTSATIRVALEVYATLMEEEAKDE